MSQKKSLPATETFVADEKPATNGPFSLILQKINPRKTLQILRQDLTKGWQRIGFAGVGHVLVSTFAVTAALCTGNQVNLGQLWEYHAQTTFFDIRGPVPPPGSSGATNEMGIVILGMDDTTMTHGTEIYSGNPSQYAYLAPIARWPWQRTAYAIAIDRLMQAGARSVVLDIVLDAPSSYGPEDDEQLRRVLAKYQGRVVLAGQYEDDVEREGTQTKLLSANSIFKSASPLTGFINFPLSPDGKIHELAREYPKRVAQTYSDSFLAERFLSLSQETPSLAEAALQAAQQTYPEPKGRDIFFYGPQNTFKQVPFWHVLDAVNWKELHLKSQTFKNKIVLIGPTAGGEIFQDFHFSPFSGTLFYPEEMPGVEIQANSIATLLQGKSINQAIPNFALQGCFVLLLVVSAGYLQSLTQRPLRRFALGVAIALAWGCISYGVFVLGRLILPTAVPMAAMLLGSSAYLFTGVVGEKLSFRRSARKYAWAPAVREMLSEAQDSDLTPWIEEHNLGIMGRTLDGRYKVIRDLASGGFGKTYIAEDTKRPDNPLCVVKRLRPTSNNPKVMKLAQRLFKKEAETLEKLGQHDRIPQLLAYFEESDDFYLVQQYIEGKSLHEELSLGSLLRRMPEQKVVLILRDLLQILEFVHQQGVIHRDIKPGNVIRRKADHQLVLIDFGAVKQVEQLDDLDAPTKLTVAIGTDGFMAPEQAAGKPCPGSDIYSVGIIGIQALTGIAAKELNDKRDPHTAQLLWNSNIQVSHALAEILDKMVHYNFSDRYRSAPEALKALQPLITNYSQPATANDALALDLILSTQEDSAVYLAEETKPWPQTLESTPEIPPTDPVYLEDGLEDDLDNRPDEAASSQDGAHLSPLEETKPWPQI
jgi:serine/threonine protein kinase/CHASE2 domain-containing sensor protein